MGFGNPVRRDDGVGVYVIEQLRPHLADVPEVSLFDMGTSAFEVLFKLKGMQRILIVDAVVGTGEAPGTLYRVPAAEIERAVVDDPLVFLHGLKWDQALSYARKILGDAYPEDISVYLIAVEDTRLEVGMNAPVQAAGDRVVHLILEDLGYPSPHPVDPPQPSDAPA